MSYNYYAVKNGRKPGIYGTWSECAAQTDGFKGAIFKGFNAKNEADKFMGYKLNEQSNKSKANNSIKESLFQKTTTLKDKGYSFVDGSFNITTNTYGFGGFLIDDDGNRHILQGSDNNLALAKMRNVAGEIWGSMNAASKALKLGMKNLTIYYDYLGIEMWVTGKWQANEIGTQYYRDYMQNLISCGLNIKFIKVKGHSGIDGNEKADILAKKAVGLLPMRN